MSGKSNVLHWLEAKQIPATESSVTRILEAAKNSPRVLTDQEIHALVAPPS
jgi:hypothetical protein